MKCIDYDNWTFYYDYIHLCNLKNYFFKLTSNNYKLLLLVIV